MPYIDSRSDMVAVHRLIHGLMEFRALSGILIGTQEAKALMLGTLEWWLETDSDTPEDKALLVAATAFLKSEWED